MSVQRLDLTFDGPVATLTIRREEKRNALSAAMLAALPELCRRVEQSSARVLIVTGAGGRAFCAGGDIAAWSTLSARDFAMRWLRDGNAAFDALARLSVPVIAVLNGHCLGGGLELAACADFRIAEAHMRIGQPEPGLGIIAGWSGTQRATRRFGAQTVRRMLLAGEVFGAEEARHLGLADRIAPEGGGLILAREMAARIVTLSPEAVALSKMMINAAEGEEGGRVIDALAGLAAARGPDLREGLAARAAGRQPDFGGDPA
ncbi:enoyl-CoA hydratase/isomerase family protein [Pseudogemmobacter bohemicus]|uniref:enoyl-CoA hydratase/isomerase family protein n=1 Tax=Pseudogemmobacter bohemicus TaxID=2250708 RepID=UPI000DD35440|nr:enoyl-CoA hydratase/isomerase family protein [Pseudogemmobacter bohemicus]